MIQACELPGESLLRKYRDTGAYTDCYFMDTSVPVSQAEYIEAFYTTWIFRLERTLLGWFVSRPSTDLQAKALSVEQSDSFAAWHVEDRTVDQLLMCDFQGRTRSWLMSVEVNSAAGTRTRLYFGSAVVPVADATSGRKKMGAVFVAMLGFHKAYSRVLLHAAASRASSGKAVFRP